MRNDSSINREGLKGWTMFIKNATDNSVINNREGFKDVVRLPGENHTFPQNVLDVDPPSTTLAQHWANILPASLVSWVVAIDSH